MVPLSGLVARYPGRIYWHPVWEGVEVSGRLASAALRLWNLGLEYPTWRQHCVTAFGLFRALRRFIRAPLDVDDRAVMCSEFVA